MKPNTDQPKAPEAKPPDIASASVPATLATEGEALEARVNESALKGYRTLAVEIKSRGDSMDLP
jgi:hypothetical protein